jgi:hypothetical protein
MTTTQPAPKRRKNSCQKGKAGEREAAEYLRSLGFHDAKRTEQHCGDNGDSDVQCPDSLPNVFIECKRDQSVFPGSKEWEAACSLAGEQANKVNQIPCVLHRRNGERKWMLTFQGIAPNLTVTVVGKRVRSALIWLNTAKPVQFRLVRVPTKKGTRCN